MKGLHWTLLFSGRLLLLHLIANRFTEPNDQTKSVATLAEKCVGASLDHHSPDLKHWRNFL